MLQSFAWLGGQEVLLAIVVILVLFGGSKIPELMKGMGKGFGELKNGIDDAKKTVNEVKP